VRNQATRVRLGAFEIAGPEKHRNRPDQRPRQRHRMALRCSVLDALVRALHRLHRIALQPQGSSERNVGIVVVLEVEMDGAAPRVARPKSQCGFELGAGTGNIPAVM
jgi:hypothetical protein